MDQFSQNYVKFDSHYILVFDVEVPNDIRQYIQNSVLLIYFSQFVCYCDCFVFAKDDDTKFKNCWHY